MANYYVGKNDSDVLGSDGNTGTSFAQRLATLSAGLAKLASPGDQLIVTARSASPLSAVLTDLPATVGSTTNPVVITGGNPVDGSVDGSIAYLTGGGTVSGAFRDNGTTRSHYWFKNMDFRNFTGTPILFSDGSSANILVYNCNFQANGSYGVRGLNGYIAIYNCTAISNTGGGGFECYGTIANCTTRNNTGIGIRINGAGIWGTTARNNIIHANSSYGVEIVSSSGATNSPVILTQNTINGNTGMGVSLTNDDSLSTVDISYNIISNNGGGGIGPQSGTAALLLPYGNHFYNNTGGNYVNASVPSWWSELTTTGDPLFVDTSTFNFNLKIGSPALKSGGGGSGALLPRFVRRSLPLIRGV
jgi:hypothetical protein